MATKYLILDQNTSHEFDLIKESDADAETLSLFYSNNNWSEEIRKTLAMSFKDTGNNVIITGLSSKKNLSINYSELVQLMLLLNSNRVLSEEKICDNYSIIPTEKESKLF
jgi:hypothetical protein